MINNQRISLGLSRAVWRQAIFETKTNIKDRDLPILAAGVAYFSVMALFPLLGAIVALTLLLVSPDIIGNLLNDISDYLPSEVFGLIESQVKSLIANRSDNIMIAIIAILIALISASAASRNLVIACNIAYGTKETRSFFSRQMRAFVWTITGISFGVVVILLLSLNKMILSEIGLSSIIVPILIYGRWLAIILTLAFGLMVFYRFGPSRPLVGWDKVAPGAIIVTIAWLMVTSLFFIYIQNYASFLHAYSVLAGMIVIMIWLNISSNLVLVGAQLNASLELASNKNS